MMKPDYDGDAFVLASEFTNNVALYRKNVKWFDDTEVTTQLTSINESMTHLQELVHFDGDITAMETASK
jgi:hypothetical protein